MKAHQLKVFKHCLSLEGNDIDHNISIKTDEETDKELKIKISTNIGIIGSPVGSGKSLIIMALMATQNIKQNKIFMNTEALQTNQLVQCYIDSSSLVYKNINVLVTPHAIINQWNTYLKTQSKLTFEQVKTVAGINKLKFDKDVILVSSGSYNKFATFVNNKNYVFSRVIYDEADSINISACVELQYNFCWFVTSSIGNLMHPKGKNGYIYKDTIEVRANQSVSNNGVPVTWSNLNSGYIDVDGNVVPRSSISQYSVSRITNFGIQYGFTAAQVAAYQYKELYKGIKKNGFIKDTFKQLEDACFTKRLFIKASDELISQSFTLPDPTYFKYYCKSQKILNILENLIPLDIQQMLCAGDLESAIKSCDIEKTNDDNLISIICNRMYIDIENKKIDLESIKLKTYQDPSRKLAAIEKCQTDIDHLLNNIENVKLKIQEADVDPITFCDIEHPTVVKCCNQKFDFESIMIYITSTNAPKCPLCRTPITKDSLIIIDNTNEPEEEETKEEPSKFDGEEFDKVENLKHLITTQIKSDAKIIIFSRYDNTFTPIMELFDQLKIEYRLLKGHSTTITNNLEWHKTDTDQQKVLFLNAQFAGAGINIHWTTDVILYHQMDRDLEMQTIGRAHRFPRKTSVNVHKLLYKNHE